MRKLILWDLMVAGIMGIGAVIFGWQIVVYESITPLAGIGVLLFIAGLWVGFLKVRCPFCHHFLGLMSTGKFCPYCGTEIK